jgi:signal peptidase II
VKLRSAILIILAIIFVDQASKFWVKTHMPLSHPWESYYHNPVSPHDNGIRVLGNKFQIYFVENEGMAWGWKFGGGMGKILLTLFRLAAVLFGSYYLYSIVRKKYHPGFIVCAALIFAGALGNLIDSMFYGLIFEESTFDHVARLFPAHGYASFLHGRVVDMLYFPLVKTHYPGWFPLVGGEDFEFFSPVFNIADASISVGVIAILLFQKRFFKKHAVSPTPSPDEHGPSLDDKIQVIE